MAFVTDTFTGTSGTALPSHTGELGASWTINPGLNSGSSQISAANRLCSNGSGLPAYYASGVPASADYDVSADVVKVTALDLDLCGVFARLATSAATGYVGYYQESGGTFIYHLAKYVAGSLTNLGNYTHTNSSSETLTLSVAGTSISLKVDGTTQIGPITDSSVTAAGRPGTWTRLSTTTTGYHLDNFSATDAVAAAGVVGRVVQVNRAVPRASTY